MNLEDATDERVLSFYVTTGRKPGGKGSASRLGRQRMFIPFFAKQNNNTT